MKPANPQPEAGMVTAETALTIPAVVAVAALLVVVLVTVGARGAACTLAGQVGRAQAVGEPYTIPRGYQVSIEELSGRKLRVTVQKESALSAWLPAKCQVVVQDERQ